MLAHPLPLGAQESVQQSPTPNRVRLDGPEVFHSEPEPGELPRAGTGPQQRVEGKHVGLLDDPEQEGSIEGELGALPHPSASLDGENRGGWRRDPILLPLPGPLFMEGLPDSALEDVESLQHLFLYGLLPSRRPEAQPAREPDDGLMPVPSLGSSS